MSLLELARTTLQLNEGVEARVSLSGPVIPLEPRHALAIGLVLHELFTNALKYGALSKSEGRIALDWALTDASEPQLKLCGAKPGTHRFLTEPQGLRLSAARTDIERRIKR